MKKLLFFISFFCFPFQIFNCPLCVGKLKAGSPLFFSDEIYQPGKAEQSAIKTQQVHEQIKKLSMVRNKK